MSCVEDVVLGVCPPGEKWVPAPSCFKVTLSFLIIRDRRYREHVSAAENTEVKHQLVKTPEMAAVLFTKTD